MNRSALRTALKLGRVSNLPTVWSNVLAGHVLNGGGLNPWSLLVLAIAGSLFYTAGMFLNDAFDRTWDAQHRPERPIPAGEVDASTVFAAGYGLLAAGVAVLALCLPQRAPAIVGVVLSGLIVLYNSNHKGNSFSPVIMGLCRVSLYLMGAFAASTLLRPAILFGCLVLLAYLILLTALAKRETLIPGVGIAVGVLIAGISLVDGLVLLAFAHPIAAAIAGLGFFVTRAFQRKIAGT